MSSPDSSDNVESIKKIVTPTDSSGNVDGTNIITPPMESPVESTFKTPVANPKSKEVTASTLPKTRNINTNTNSNNNNNNGSSSTSKVSQARAQLNSSSKSHYRQLSIGSNSSTGKKNSSNKRISGINFNIPVVSSEDSNQPPTSQAGTPPMSLSNKSENRMSHNLIDNVDISPTPSPETPRFPQISQTLDDGLSLPGGSSPSKVNNEDTLSKDLRELATKEAEILEIKETIKNLLTKKKTMEMEFEVLKKNVEKNLYKHISSSAQNTPIQPQLGVFPNPPSRKNLVASPSSNKNHTRQHPLDDNFNSSTTNSQSSSLANLNNPPRQRQTNRDSGVGGSNNKKSSLWGILSQVDNYIQSEFEKLNFLDLSEQQNETTATESFYEVPSQPEELEHHSSENRIKNLFDDTAASSAHGYKIPSSIKSVVDAVIHGGSHPDGNHAQSSGSSGSRDKKDSKSANRESWNDNSPIGNRAQVPV
ncbi:hypothetical protein PACTADRAFT_18664 [Pachysolen tannophilus NRRL Y-2460]|uniref:Topoisomerase I damage affected protein 11 n=1 Tax=Pachysolen tannophilus NRRL Y-2460 TaxID=669874 RepID=A0A1E4TN53_PACTA|nr:hypothetical protein PACTADRAFT_18664 [Pachysolen tannophilus NRRL Y-2460]